MPSKLERFFIGRFRKCSFQGVLLGTSLLLFPLSAHATLSFSMSGTGSVVYNGTSYVAYVGAITGGTNALTNLADTAGGFSVVNLQRYAFEETPTSRPNIVTIGFTSSLALTSGGQNYGVNMFYTPANSSTAKAAPIIQLNAVDCSTSICSENYPGIIPPATIPFTNPAGTTTLNQTYFFSAALDPSLYTNGAISTIGTYPKDVCNFYYQTVTGAAQGTAPNCALDTDGFSTLIPTPVSSAAPSGTTSSLFLTVNVGVMDASGAIPTVADTGTIEVRFQVTAPTLNCPDLSGVYTPGQGQIFLQTEDFSANTAVGAAPTTAMLALINQGQTNDPSVSLPLVPANYTSIQRVSLGGQTAIPGFTDSTQSSPVPYAVAFAVRDAAGLLAMPTATAPNASGACVIEGVETAAIYGFLKKGNCFIATATYESTEAPPVLMLREFRDRVLMHFNLGRRFVGWYYSWSPWRAEWLVEHPVYRYPVLMALIPVELFAWVAIHPLWLVASLLGGVILAFVFRPGRDQGCDPDEDALKTGGENR